MTKIFVFGSNLAGRHGAGAARYAREHYGAEYGVGVGPSGQSYAIPTKDYVLKTLTLAAIQRHIEDFIEYARKHKENEFLLTPIGCGLAGYRRDQIRPLIDKCNPPSNVFYSKEWEDPDVN